MSDNVKQDADKANPVVVIDNVEYNVIEGPGDASALVQLARKRVLANFTVENLVAKLDRTDDLLFATACSVAGQVHSGTGKSLSAEVMALQFELRKNIGRLPSEALRFGEAARNLLAILRGAVRDLYSLHEADALARLSRCEPIAQEMAATAAATPVDSFEALFMNAIEIRDSLWETSKLHDHELHGAQQQQLDMEARNEGVRSARAALELQMAKIQELDEAAKAAQSRVDRPRFTQTTLADITKAFGGISAGLAFDPLQHEGDTELVAAYAREKSKYLELQTDLKRQERVVLDAMADHAAELQSANNHGEFEQAAVVSLGHVEDCLRSIIVILKDQRNFLGHVGAVCARLNDIFRRSIEGYMNESREERIKEYSKPGFQARVLELAANLHALELVAGEYRAATLKLYDKVGQTYKRNPTIEEAHRLIPALGKALALVVAKDIA